MNTRAAAYFARDYMRGITFRPGDTVVVMPLTGEYEPSGLDWSQKQVAKIIASGTTDGITIADMPVILLTTLGAKSGKLRKIALMRVEHNGEYALVASLGGAPRTPSGTTTSKRTRLSNCKTAVSPRTTRRGKSAVTRRLRGGIVPSRPTRPMRNTRPRPTVRSRFSC